MQEDKNELFQMRFPQKLWYLLNLRTDAILWGGTGRTILLNYRILHNYLQCDNSIFKTTNISSFVRQLNLYGFRKVTSHLQDPLCNSSNPYMHEYVHDYFQFGRPELLNKITRKALTMKRNFKPQIAFNNVEQLLCLTPLQKARHALSMALKKASHEIFLQNSPKLSSMKFDYEDSQEYLGEEEETIEFDWSTSNNVEQFQSSPKTAAENVITIAEETLEEPEEAPNTSEGQQTFGDSNQDNLMSFTEVSCGQTTESLPSQFISMPDLDSTTAYNDCDMELLAEFNIDNDVDQGIIRKLSEDSGNSSLNCVLPSINHEQIDDEPMTEMNSEYNAEWDQMFNDIMTNKGPNQEYGSDLKDLYSQISKTIDLLNS